MCDSSIDKLQNISVVKVRERERGERKVFHENEIQSNFTKNKVEEKGL